MSRVRRATATQVAVHCDLWSFESDGSVFELPELATSLLASKRGPLDVLACRGTQCWRQSGAEPRQLREMARELEPTAMLIRGQETQGVDTRSALTIRFVLSPLHPSWHSAGASLPEENQFERDLLRITRSVQASVAWNQAKVFPTTIGGVRESDLRGDSEHEQLDLLAASFASKPCPRIVGVIDILPTDSLRLGLREFLAEHPLRAPLLNRGLDRLHHYVLSTHTAQTRALMELLRACGAVRREIPNGELLYLPEGLQNTMERALASEHMLPRAQDPSVRRASETLGEFMLPDGRLLLNRQRSLELARSGYWVPLGAGDEKVLLPLEEHCAKLGLAEGNALEVVVQRENALRLRGLLMSLENEAHCEAADSEAMIAGYSRALRQWPFGGFYGPSTSSLIELLRRIMTSVEPLRAKREE